MLTCWRLRGAMAASVYGEASPDEQRRLDAHLNTCPRCRERWAAFAALAGARPVSPPELDRDLSPAILATIRADRPSRRIPMFGPAWASVAVAAVALAVVAIPYLYLQRGAAVVAIPPTPVAQSPVEKAILQADSLADKRDFASAYRILKQAIEAHPDDPAAAEAQSRGADIAFSELHWYAEAHDDYDRLAKQYPSRFREDPGASARRDLLAEAQTNDFASLYALDAARRHGGEAFARLEQVIGRYPGTFVASLAAHDMARLTLDTSTNADRIQAFMAARDRCTDPAARAQLSMELGHVYLKELKQPAKASEQYREAAAAPNAVLAKLAEECLSRISSGN
ncbi:MAG TPA: zf-HC2 domain-containing protein [Candidatus Hydrogenedentes bacterium]|nr:zf-HC2 domain-containing protein [Candidatus Hydrogenedentota bacterium]HRT19535.1 zf-HC2 domain-containing protein [Candidatus Hydrogenedentota bacterium]HRT64209.1 zf-HC2 domain-containing protein [Candidatus Hydrogenedentota bacterium]